MPTSHQLSILPSGVRVATVEMPHMESVSIGFWNAVGSRHETAENNGVAHLIEHLLFKGTPSRSAEEISRQIERVGGSIDAFTSEDHTGYQVKGPADQMSPLLEVLCDFYQHPNFNPADLENERSVIHEEIAMVRDQPSQWIDDLTSAAAWPDHPLGRPITGTTESLDGLDRDRVFEFYRNAYTAGQTIVTVAGRVSHEEVMTQLETLLNGVGAAPPVPVEPVVAAEPGFIFSAREDLEQAHLSIGFHACGRHDEERYAQKLLNVLLGENMSSRLFQELREREALCYEIQSDIMAYEDCGLLNVYLALDPGQIPRALESLGRVLKEFVDRPPSISQLDEAKSYVIGQSRIALENTSAQMTWAGECLLSFDRVIDPDVVHGRLAAVRAEEAQALASRIFRSDNRVIATIGPSEIEGRVREWEWE